DKIRNGLLCRARALLEVADLFSNEASGREAIDVLDRMPADVVAETKENKRKRLGWAGRKLEEMAEASDIVGHRAVYGTLSLSVHGRLAGYDVQGARKENGALEMQFAPRPRARDVHALANFTRRFLHRAYWVVVTDWLGVAPPLKTSNPEEGRTW